MYFQSPASKSACLFSLALNNGISILNITHARILGVSVVPPTQIPIPSTSRMPFQSALSFPCQNLGSSLLIST